MLVGVVELWSVWKAAATYIFSTPSPIGVDVEISVVCRRPADHAQFFPHACVLTVERNRDFPHYARSFSRAPWIRLTRSANVGASRIISETRSKLWITVE
jgi:hypothetical protein